MSDCHDCDPPIPDTLYATLAKLEGDFAFANGKQTLTCTNGCHWQWDAGGGRHVDLVYVPDHEWSVFVYGKDVTTCRAEFIGLFCGGLCEPWNCDYNFDRPGPTNCDSSTCDDTDSCADSNKATCEVSTS